MLPGRLERGWLDRLPVPGDRRAVRIALTPTGREALDRAESAMVDRLLRVLETTADGDSVLACLARLGPAVEQSGRR